MFNDTEKIVTIAILALLLLTWIYFWISIKVLTAKIEALRETSDRHGTNIQNISLWKDKQNIEEHKRNQKEIDKIMQQTNRANNVAKENQRKENATTRRKR